MQPFAMQWRRCSVVRTFATQLHDAMAARFGGEHLLRSRSGFVARMRKLYRDLGLCEDVATTLASAVESGTEAAVLASTPSRQTALRFPKVEPPVRARVAVLGDAPGPSCSRAASERALMLEIFDELDALEDPGLYLARLRVWLAVLDRDVQP